MYQRLPQPTQNDVIGQQVAEANKNMVFEVWPENWPAWQLFASLATQWRVGMGGRTGLAYEAAYPLMDRMGLSSVEWHQMFDDLQEMEGAALSASNSD